MKNKLLILALVAMTFAGCEDLLLVSIDTNLKKSLDIDVANSGLKSGGFHFEKSDTLNMEDNEDLAKYIDKIKEVDVNYIGIKISGIPAGEKINDLTLSIPQVNFTYTITDITENLFEYKVDSNDVSTLAAIGTYLLNQKKVKIEVYGNSSSAPIKLKVDLDFDSKVKASPLSE